RSQRDRPAGIADRGGEGRKVTRQHRGCRNELSLIARVLAESRALVPAEEKQLVLDYRSTGCSAELMALQRTAFRRKITPRIEQIIAYEFERITVELIRTRLRHGAYL